MSLRRFLKRFFRRRSGVTAVEFSLVATPFFVCLFAIIENTTLYFAQQTLENAVVETGRLVRTGQVFEQGITREQFRQRVCDMVVPLLTCDARLELDVRQFDDFDNIAAPDPTMPDGSWNPALAFDPGGAGDIVLVRAFYNWDRLTPMMSNIVMDTPDGSLLLTSSAAFRNEPFDSILGPD